MAEVIRTNERGIRPTIEPLSIEKVGRKIHSGYQYIWRGFPTESNSLSVYTKIDVSPLNSFIIDITRRVVDAQFSAAFAFLLALRNGENLRVIFSRQHSIILGFLVCYV